MLTLFTQEQASKMEILSERKEAKAEGIAEGLVQGKLQGEEEAKRRMAKNMYCQLNMSVDVIAGLVERNVDTVKDWLGIQTA